MGFISNIGITSDSAVATFNKVPYVDIKYPIPHILIDQNKKKPMLTNWDVLQRGINFYDSITDISMKSNQPISITDIEKEALVTALKGGVIVNGSSS